MKIDGVFSGGGVKAFAFIGAMEQLEEKGYSFERVAGSSAGAILASLLAAGYKNEELKEIFMDLDVKQFMDGARLERYLPFIKWISLYFALGLYKGDVFEHWIHDTLAKKNIYTFADLPPGTLKVIVADLTVGKMVVIPDDVKRIYGVDPSNFPVAKAVRMSASLPYFFRPKKIWDQKHKKHIIVDGSLLSNLPMWVFDGDRKFQKRPLLGIKLSANYDKIMIGKITDALKLTKSLFTTMQIAHDQRYIVMHQQNNVLFLPVSEVGVADFHLSQASKQNLVDLGKTKTAAFLKNWPH
ncbi:NTE family protein [Natronobacillus azotifigens]|uniref:Patatin-like phospholipase family protein n=1 Tax=Natronobacillus azotifigens TaxID=472978 RepID=A0A9J6RF58_9BACI|nr:patatin-like phospholipase family protein [Natronobacillus azotifigens]MCZ0704077.1 patatin-like phospholipase family protein [Natronobacillus azotifigens]